MDIFRQSALSVWHEDSMNLLVYGNRGVVQLVLNEHACILIDTRARKKRCNSFRLPLFMADDTEDGKPRVSPCR